MKKLLLVASILAMGTVAFGKEVVPEPVTPVPEWAFALKGAFDMNAMYNTDWNSTQMVDEDSVGWEVALEGFRTWDYGLELGLGVAYQGHGRSAFYIQDPNGVWAPGVPGAEVPVLDKDGNFGYDSIPVYGIVKYALPTTLGLDPYVRADLGYSFNKGLNNHGGDFTNGLYWAAGIGAQFDGWFTEVMYKQNLSEFGTWEGASNATYQRVNIGFGYMFNF